MLEHLFGRRTPANGRPLRAETLSPSIKPEEVVNAPDLDVVEN